VTIEPFPIRQAKSVVNSKELLRLRSNSRNNHIRACLALLFFLFACNPWISAAELVLEKLDTVPVPAGEPGRPGQIPHSRVAHGSNDIAGAWLAMATDRYPHSVLGDSFEASRLAVESRQGKFLILDLPPHRVFEDLQPRLIDLDGDGRDEIIVVESDTRLGASLSVYGIVDGLLAKRTATPFLGRPNRWLNPLGVGDFDGDGKLDIALVATPHIGGVLRLYHFLEPELSKFAEYTGVSTHSLGSTELGLGREVENAPRDQLLLPDQSHRKMLLLEWTPDGWLKHDQVDLPDVLRSSLMPSGENRWKFRLRNNLHYEIRVDP